MGEEFQGTSQNQVSKTMTRIEYMKKMREDQDVFTERAYRFLCEHMQEDPRYQEYLKKCYDERAKDEEEQALDFDSWFKTTYFNPDKRCFKEGVEDWLGQMHHRGILDQWLKDIKFSEFLDGMIDEPFECHMVYSDGRRPGTVYDMMFNPSVNITIDLTERFAYLKDYKNWK